MDSPSQNVGVSVAHDEPRGRRERRRRTIGSTDATFRQTRDRRHVRPLKIRRAPPGSVVGNSKRLVCRRGRNAVGVRRANPAVHAPTKVDDPRRGQHVTASLHPRDFQSRVGKSALEEIDDRANQIGSGLAATEK